MTSLPVFAQNINVSVLYIVSNMRYLLLLNVNQWSCRLPFHTLDTQFRIHSSQENTYL